MCNKGVDKCALTVVCMVCVSCVLSVGIEPHTTPRRYWLEQRRTAAVWTPLGVLHQGRGGDVGSERRPSRTALSTAHIIRTVHVDHRDLLIIRSVTRFGQLSTHHIRVLVFNELLSDTPLDRALLRLVGARYLARIERQRLIGGARGGSGMYVYQAGMEGFRLFHEGGKYSPMRAINYHMLYIADVFVMLKKLELAGKLRIVHYLTEYQGDCHVTIGEHVLKPDLFVEIERPDGTSRLQFMLEIDMGTQGQKQIGEKLVRYYKAAQLAEDNWPQHRLVMFVAIDDDRASELRELIKRGSPEEQAMFRVRTLAGLEAELS